MELMQLRYFMVVAEMENMTKAAESLYLTQPALSRSISRLEADLDIRLFHRSANRIALTEAGKLYLKAVKAAFESLDQGLSAARSLDQKQHVHIKVVSGIGIMKEIAQDYHREHPAVDITVELASGKTAAMQVLAGKADFGISLEKQQGDLLDNEVLMAGGFYLVTAAGQELYNQKEVSLWDLQDKVLFCSPYGNTKEIVESQFASYNLKGTVMELDGRELLFDAVAKELGYAVCLPMMSVYQGSRMEKQIRFIPITECAKKGKVVLISQPGRKASLEVQSFLSYVRQIFAENDASLRKMTV